MYKTFSNFLIFLGQRVPSKDNTTAVRGNTYPWSEIQKQIIHSTLF